MQGERRGRGQYGRAITYADELVNIMQRDDEPNTLLGMSKDRVATAAVLLAIVVSLAGAFVVVVESTSEPPARKHVTIAIA
jgi:hypothetical protein